MKCVVLGILIFYCHYNQKYQNEGAKLELKFYELVQRPNDQKAAEQIC